MNLSSLRELIDYQQFAQVRAIISLTHIEANNPALLPLLAIADAQLGDWHAAFEALDQAQAHAAQLDTDGKIDLAGAYSLLGQVANAVELLETALRIQPSNALALSRLAFCRIQQGRLDDALELYQHCLELPTHQLPALLGLIRLILMRSDTAAAQQVLNISVAKLEFQKASLPTSAVKLLENQIRSLQLQILLNANRVAEIESCLERQRKQLDQSDWAELIKTYANMLCDRGRYGEADEALWNALQHVPDQLDLITAGAELALKLGRHTQAIETLRRAIRLAKRLGKPTAGLWSLRAHASLKLNIVDARLAAERAIELAEKMIISTATPELMVRTMHLQAKVALAHVENTDRYFDTATQIFREVLEENPYFVPALHGLAQQYIRDGNVDEAISLFKRLRQINSTTGYTPKSIDKFCTDDEETLYKIERAARQSSINGEIRSDLMYQLANAWHTLENYDLAFDIANDANTNRCQHSNYDPVNYRHRCARIRQTFCKELFEYRQDCGYRGDDATLPIFIVGLPRSGTSLIERILANHSDIFSAGELSIIPNQIQHLNRRERQVGSGRYYPDCIDDMSPLSSRQMASGIIDELRGLASEAKPHAKLVVDSLPENVENIGLIKFLFPSAKIISVQRDPRDLAISNYFTDQQAGGDDFACHLEWIGMRISDHTLLMNHWNSLFPGEIIELKYEDIVENTEFQVRRLLKYLGVKWESQVLDIGTGDHPFKTTSIWPVSQPIHRKSIGKWQYYEKHLGPLIKGANTKIDLEPIKINRLPTPGMLNNGVLLYAENKLNDAEHEFKQLLQHLPDHATANHMLGNILALKGQLQEAIHRLEKALSKCPWNLTWRDDLIRVCEMAGDTERADKIKTSQRHNHIQAGYQ